MTGPLAVIERLAAAQNAHDIDAMVACFAEDYESEQPAHPDRAFRGSAQVRANWSEIFAGVPDLRAELVASPSQEALGRLTRIDEDTVVVALTAGRPHPLISRTIKLARHRKARTVAIVDATLSEIAKLSQITLYYSSNSPAYVRSHTALLSLIQGLAQGVYARDAHVYEDRIKAFRLK